ncbi:hypothetical protein [Microlunatus ginsengisoli]|uniref:Uncharacterized protein n=1 Tax=Microlunatus ginsengisoli TaxID=363863 RepID=A0ABP7AGH7_9ACTN
MRPDHLSYRRLVKSALVGALIGVVFDLAVAFLTRSASPFSVGQVPSYIAFGIVGFAGGWLFELFKAQTEVTDESVRTLTEMQHKVELLTRRLTYADEALTMLSAAPRHNEALTALIKASLSDSFRSIPYVGVPAYLTLLGMAISHADSYEGTHRTTFRWFFEREAGHYLNGLRDKAMSVKTRLVLIDDDDLDVMREDLANPEVMGYYWRHTGDTETFWMTVSEFRRAFPRRDVPRDLALYDRELWVAYDEPNQTLSFDVVPAADEVCKLFGDLREMIGRGQPELKRVERG